MRSTGTCVSSWLALSLALLPALVAAEDAAGGVEVLPVTGYAQHVHGGAPAKVASTSLRLEAGDAAPHEVRVVGVELLSRVCRETAWSSRSPLQVRGVTWSPSPDGEDEDVAGAVPVLTVAGSGVLRVRFDAVSVYQACDGFGFAVSLELDGVAHEVEVPLEVKRYEPLRAPIP